MEGPSIRIVAEKLAVFKGKIVKLASGNAMHALHVRSCTLDCGKIAQHNYIDLVFGVV